MLVFKLKRSLINPEVQGWLDKIEAKGVKVDYFTEEEMALWGYIEELDDSDPYYEADVPEDIFELFLRITEILP